MAEATHRIYLCAGAHCQSHGREATRKALEAALWDLGLDAQIELRDSGCQDRCAFGPNATIWPGPYRYHSLSSDQVLRLIESHVRDGIPISELLADEQHRR